MTTAPNNSGKRIVFKVLCLFFSIIISAPLWGADFHEKTNKIFVSILPQKYFVEKIAGSLVEVEVMVKPGHSPSTYEPTPRQVTGLSNASIYFSIGVPFENAFLERLKSLNPELKIVSTDEGIKKRVMKAAHDCEDECGHEEGSLDPHIWLDPVLVKKQAENIAKALKTVFPDKSELFNSNLVLFSKELDKLTDELSKTLAPLKGNIMLVFHPAFGYFADRFGLLQEAIEIEGKEPTPRQMVGLIRKAKQEKVKIIFVQKQFSTKAAQTIANAISGKVVQIDPLQEDYLKNLNDLASALRAGYPDSVENEK